MAMAITDSDTLEAEIAAARWTDPERRPQGGAVYLPGGVLTLTRPVRFHNVKGLKLVGDNTRIIYDGPPAPAVFEFEAAHSCELSGVVVTQTGRLGLTESVVRMKSPDVTTGLAWITSANRLTDVEGAHNGAPPFVYGINLVNPVRDANNEDHTFTRCGFRNYTMAGVHIRGGQIHNLLFDRCKFSDDAGRGQYGIWGEYGNFYELRNCTLNAHRDCDVFAQDFTHRVVLQGCNGENSRRLLRTQGNPTPVAIRDHRWAGKPQVGDWILDYLPLWSSIVLENVSITSTVAVDPRLRLGQYWPQRGVTVRDCMITQSVGPYPTLPPVVVFPGTPVQQGGNVYRCTGTDPWDRRMFTI